MKQERISAEARRAVNLSLDPRVVADAKELGINISQVCEHGLAVEVSRMRGELWLRENAEALAGWNDWIDKNGLPLAEYRAF